MRSKPILLTPLAILLVGMAGLFLALGGDGAGAADGRDLPEPRGPGRTHSAQGELPQRTRAENPTGAPLVVGEDERVRIEDTTAYPFSAVVWLELYNEFDEEIGNCTGTFIGPDAILTAGHCLYDGVDGWVANVAVVPGRDDDFEPFGWEWAADWWVPDGWYDTGADLFDWGIIRMPNSELGDLVGWFYIAELTTETLLADHFEPAIVGYPADAWPPATMWFGWQPWFVDVDEFILYHEIDTYPGTSGAAVFSSNLESEWLGAIVGIHVRGDSLLQLNEAMRIDAFIIADLDEGCIQMGCTFVYYVEEPPPTPTPTVKPTATPSSTPPAGPLGFKLRLPFIGRD